MSSSLGFFASQISGHLYTLTGSYDALATVTVPSGGASNVTFSAIPQTGYKHLQLRWTAIDTYATGDSLVMQFNGDTASNYVQHALYGNGSSAVGTYTAAGAYLPFGYSNTSSYPFTGVTDILDYTSTTKNKTVRTLDGQDANGSGYIFLHSGMWFKTPESINSIKIYNVSGTFAQYSQFSLYGIK